MFVRFLKGNNSALGGKRVLLKVANERYCNIVLIFCVFFRMSAREKASGKKNAFFGYLQCFFGPLGVHGYASPPQGLEVRGP